MLHQSVAQDAGAVGQVYLGQVSLASDVEERTLQEGLKGNKVIMVIVATKAIMVSFIR